MHPSSMSLDPTLTLRSLAHDLHNLLHGLGLNLTFLESQVDPELAEVVRECASAVSLSGLVTRGVLHAGGDPRPTALRSAIDDVVEALGPSLGGLRLQLTVPASIQVLCEPAGLRSALLNLLQNAAREARSHLHIQASVADGLLHLSVSDDGGGVPEALRARLFELGVSGREGGTGLGLFLTRDFAQRSGGRLTLDRSGPDGSTFTLRLPLA